MFEELAFFEDSGPQIDRDGFRSLGLKGFRSIGP